MAKSAEDDDINRKAQRELLEAQEKRSAQAKSDKELLDNPDSAQSMEKHFSGQADKERESKVNEVIGNARYRQALAAQQKDISSRGLRMGGFTPDYATRTNIKDGAAGIIAAGGKNYTPTLKVGAGVEEMKALADMSGAMQRHRRQVKEYERREQEKKKNDGGLSAARQEHRTTGLFPTRPMFTIGGGFFTTMKFDDKGRPIVGVFSAAEDGHPGTDVTQSQSTVRSMYQAGRNYRQTFGGSAT